MTTGAGNVLLLRGWCSPPESRAARLQVVANGVAHPVTTLGRAGAHAAAFAAYVPFARAEAGQRVEVGLQARLRNGTTCSGRLGSIEVVAETPSSSEPAISSARVAICMTTYEPPLPLLRDQIESIRRQSFPDWVCLVSDDGSDPEAYEAIVRIVGGDPRFQVSASPRRLGFYANFERCLSLVPPGVAFVALSDHDDRWHPDKLQVLLDAFQADTTLVYSDMNVIDETGRLLSSTYWTTRPNRWDDLASLLVANTITGAASMFRASLLTHLLPFPQKVGEAFHDQWIACLALARGQVRYVDRPLYDYVQHSSNVLGHYAPPVGAWWSKAREYSGSVLGARGRERIRATLAGWAAIYDADVQKVKLNARVLQLRCAADMTPAKAAAVNRLARLDEAWPTTGWLALRALAGLGRVTETLGGEATLLRGLAWALWSRLRFALAPGSRPGK